MSSEGVGNVHPLVPGSIKDIVEGQKPPSIWLQVIYIKPMDKEGNTSSNGTTRYKVAVSDGRHFIQAMVVAPLSQALDTKRVEQWSIVRVTSYQLNNMKGHTFLVLGGAALEDTIMAGSKYGEPTNVEHSLAANAEAAPQKASLANFVPITASVPVAAAAAASSTTATSAYSGGTNLPPTGTTYAATVPAPQPMPAKPNSFQSNLGKNIPAATGFCEEPEALQAIANLSPYHNRWAIKARIINKSEVKRFANVKGEGKLFSCTCIDGTGEIRMTAFGETVDKFFDLILEGQVYYISNAQVKIAKRQFGVRNEYEIHLEPSSVVNLARDAGEIPSLKFVFVPIAQITTLEKDATCDVIGIIKEAGDLGSITTKTTQKQLSKRDLTLLDTSGCSIRVTLWGTQAEQFQDVGDYPIMAIRGVRVSDYNGRTLSTLSSSTIVMNPDMREAHELRGWFDAQGIHQESRSVSTAASMGGGLASAKDDRKTISQIKEDHLGQGDKPDFFSLPATIVYIKSDATVSYTACPTDGCNKKVIEEGPNMWRCEKCSRVYDHCDHRYILSLQVADHTGQTWLNAFNETGEQLLGKTAEELYYLRQSDEAAYGNVFKEALFKSYMFRIRAKQENYQGEMKLRCNILAALSITPEDECKYLLDKIESK